MTVEDPTTLAEEAARLLAQVQETVLAMTDMAIQAQGATKAALQVRVRTMLKRFEAVDLQQHDLQRLKGQLTALKGQIKSLNQHQPQQTGVKASQQDRRGQKRQNQPLKVRAQTPFQRRRPK